MPTSRRERLAIVSTRNILCGIAAYTAALERQLIGLFDVTVFDLNQYLLRSRHPRVRRLADRHVDDICRAIAGFDAVNLQLEYGTLGRSIKDIRRRFSRLIEAAPRLSVTFHTVNRPPVFPLGDFLKAIAGLRWRTADDIHAEFRRSQHLSLGIAKRLHREQRRKQVSVIVHNRRDHADMRHLHGFDRVFDHPLAFLSAAEASAVKSGAKRQRFPLLDSLSPDDILIGVFGFLNEYKGLDTGIRALRHLPENHHLLIFGGMHPNEILPHQRIHPHLATLMETTLIDISLLDRLRAMAGKGSLVRANLDRGSGLAKLLEAYLQDLSHRIHFMGALDDADFLAGMAICDAVVFPYLEVGQSSSGPISQALELGCRIIASRTHAFLEFAAYHPNTIEFFDIGNHLELAGRIAARPQPAVRREPLRYNSETNKAIYLAANSTSVDAAPRFRLRRRAATEAGRGRVSAG